MKGRHPRNNPYEFQVTEQVTELWNRLPRKVTVYLPGDIEKLPGHGPV